MSDITILLLLVMWLALLNTVSLLIGLWLAVWLIERLTQPPPYDPTANRPIVLGRTDRGYPPSPKDRRNV